MCAERTRCCDRGAGLGVAARELDQRGRAARVVVRPGPDAGVVAVRHHDDRVGRLPAGDGPEVLEAHPCRGPARPPARLSVVTGRPYGAQLVSEPLRRPQRARRRPGTRSGKWLAKSRRQLPCRRRRRSSAAAAAPAAAPGRVMLKARIRSGSERTRKRAAVEAGVDGTLERAAPRAAATAPLPGLQRAIADSRGLSSAAGRTPMPDSDSHDPARRRRGRRPQGARLPARARRLHGRPGGRRRGGAAAASRHSRDRPRRARHHAAEARRARGLQAAAGDEHRADHHADRPRRRARQGDRPRARRRRLHHEAVLDPRVPLARAGAAPPGTRAPRAGREPARS